MKSNIKGFLILGLVVICFGQNVEWAFAGGFYFLRPKALSERAVMDALSDEHYTVENIAQLRDGIDAIVTTVQQNGFSDKRNPKYAIQALSRISQMTGEGMSLAKAQALVFDWACKFLHNDDRGLLKAVEAITSRKLPRPMFRDLLSAIDYHAAIIENPEAFLESPSSLWAVVHNEEYDAGFAEGPLSLGQAESAILAQLKKDYTDERLARESRDVQDTLRQLDAARKKVIAAEDRLRNAQWRADKTKSGRQSPAFEIRQARRGLLDSERNSIRYKISNIENKVNSINRIKAIMGMLTAQHAVNEMWNSLSDETKARVAELKRADPAKWKQLFAELYSVEARNGMGIILNFCGGAAYFRNAPGVLIGCAEILGAV